MTERVSNAARTGAAGFAPRAVALTLALSLAIPAPGFAQDAPGGRQVTFGIDSRLSAQRNTDLTPGGKVQTVESNTRLSFGLRSETPSSFISLDTSARLRFDNGSTTARSGLTDPDIALAFRREGPASFIAGTAFLRETDLARADLTQPDLIPGEIIDLSLPPVGTRRIAGATLSYRWGEDRRVGYGLTARLADTRYDKAPGQTDNRRTNLGADMRLDLNEVMRLTLGVDRGRFVPKGGTARNTTALTASLSIDRPRGPLTFGATLTDTPEGTRTGLSVGRSLDLPDGRLSAQIGVTRGVAGKLGLTGALGYTRDLPDGRITATLSRQIAAGSETDTETTQTRASLSYSRELTALTRLTLDLALTESRTAGSGVTTRNSTLGATLSHELGQDWMLDAGYRMRRREATAQAAATNPSIFLGLRREFVASY